MDLKSKIEAVLLAYGEPISLKKLAEAVEGKEDVVREGVRALSAEYLSQGRGFAILENNDSVQLVSHSECSDCIKRLKRVEDESTLSPATLEVLSIILYRSPITRTEIEMIRGVNCSSILRSLSIRGLLDRTEHTEDSRSYSYAPSFALLKLLGIKTQKDLPNYDELSRNGKLYPEIEAFVSK